MSKSELISTVEACCILATNGDLRIKPCQPNDGSVCRQLDLVTLCKKGISRDPDTNVLQCPLQRGVLTVISNNGAEK